MLGLHFLSKSSGRWGGGRCEKECPLQAWWASGGRRFQTMKQAKNRERERELTNAIVTMLMQGTQTVRQKSNVVVTLTHTVLTKNRKCDPRNSKNSTQKKIPNLTQQF